MKLLMHELYKHFSGRILWIVMALLVLLNVLFCLREVGKDYDAEYADILKAADSVVRENPEQVYARYLTMNETNSIYSAELEKWVELQFSFMGDPSEMPPQPTEPNYPSEYYEGINDYIFLSAYYREVLTKDEYTEKITALRETAQNTLNEYRAAGYSSDSYAYRYQVRFWNIYGYALEDVKPNESLSYGWDAFWKYDGSGIFLFLAAILVGSRLFTIERDSGMEPILRACRRGRYRLGLSKLSAAVIWMLGISLLFHLSALAVCGYYYGLSDPFTPIQQSPSMIYCPYPFSQLGTFLLTVLTSALASLALCLLTACFTLLLKRAMPAIAISAAVVGLEFLLLEQGGEYFSNINFLVSAIPIRLWERWLPIHAAGRPISYLPFLFGMLGLIALVAGGLSLIRWVLRGMGAARSPRIRLPQLRQKQKRKVRLRRKRTLRLLPYELYKPISVRVGLICLLLVALQIGISFNTLDGEPTFYDEMKARYMQEYEGLSLEEAEAAAAQRLDAYEEATAEGKASEMAAKRISDEITYEEYTAYLDLLNEALTYKETLSAYRQELNYLIEKQNETGIETYPVLSSGFETWASRPFDIPVMVMLLVLLTGVFAREHESKFMPLLRTTKKGRRPVWLAKHSLAALCSLVVALAAIVLDAVLLLTRYPTEFLSAPLICISRYKNTSFAISGGEYLLLVCLMRLLGTLFFGWLTAAISQLLRSEWATAGCMLLCFLPYGLTLLGVESAKLVDFTLLLSGDRLWLVSTSAGGITLVLVFIGAVAVLTSLLSTLSYRKFCE